MDKQKKKNRIGWGMIVALILSAIFVDYVNTVPILGGFISSGYWITVSFYLWKTGHGLFNWKNIIPESISFITEWIPMISILPTVLIATIIIIFISRFEDKTGIKLSPRELTERVTPPRKSAPLNSDPGVRRPRQQNISTEEIS